jgi:hypothetical protein
MYKLGFDLSAIYAQVVSMGRYGKTQEIAGSLPERVVNSFIKQ